MASPLWPAIDVTSWQKVQTESRGQREKWWLLDPEPGGEEWLRKAPRPSRPSEPAIEVFALQLAHDAGVHAAEGRPCIWHEATATRRGIVVKLFLDRSRSTNHDRPSRRSSEEMSLGSEVLQSHVSGYDPECNWAQTPTNVRDSLARLGESAGTDLVTPFAFMLAFDAWIGNVDRHQQNWGVIRRGRSIRLAPMFDPASCLGVELLEEHELLRGPSEQMLRKYVDNCPSGFGDGTRQLRMRDVVAQVCDWPEWTNNVTRWLAGFEKAANTTKEWLAAVPVEWLTDARKELANALLKARLDWLKEAGQ